MAGGKEGGSCRVLRRPASPTAPSVLLRCSTIPMQALYKYDVRRTTYSVRRRRTRCKPKRGSFGFLQRASSYDATVPSAWRRGEEHGRARVWTAPALLGRERAGPFKKSHKEQRGQEGSETCPSLEEGAIPTPSRQAMPAMESLPCSRDNAAALRGAPVKYGAAASLDQGLAFGGLKLEAFSSILSRARACLFVTSVALSSALVNVSLHRLSFLPRTGQKELAVLRICITCIIRGGLKQRQRAS